MKCAKCSAELPSGAAACPRCFSPVTAEEQPSAPSAQSGRKKLYILAAASVLLLVIVASLLAKFAFGGKSITQADAGAPASGPAVTNAPPGTPSGGPSVTNAPPPQPAQNGPGNQDPAKVQAPQEVLDYLEFVKQIEQSRQTLLKDTVRAVGMAAGQAQAESLMDMIDMAMDDSAQATQKPKRVSSVQRELGIHMQNWNQLVQNFDSKAAPEQCRVFSGYYRGVLTTETSRINTILGVVANTNWSDMESIKRSLSALQSMKSDPNLQGGIDKAVETADSSLGQLCSYYSISKPFEVKKEEDSGGSIMGGGL